MNSMVAVATGAALGAWIRWGVSICLNGIGMIPLGTLLVNALGGLLMGIALGLLQVVPQLSPELRLFMTTGFLGGLTTFSTFSGEVFSLLQKQAYLWACLHMFTHVALSVALTALGYWWVMRWQ